MSYARLTEIEVFNFMSIKHARVMFDETNILNIKGYNDSGKSALLRAVAICLADQFKTKQVNFIRFGCDYFRIICKFEDDILIVRDKYRNGQSLYEMYKGKDLIFTTKAGNTLTKITGVPEPIEKYVGFCMLGNECLNYQNANNTKMLLVETTGGENYKDLNTILKIDEISRASELVKADKGEAKDGLVEVNASKDVVEDEYKLAKYLTEELLEELEKRDAVSDKNEEQYNALKTIQDGYTAYSSIKVAPKVEKIDATQYAAISALEAVSETYQSFKVPPQLKKISVDSRLSELSKLSSLFGQLAEKKDTLNKKIPTITNAERLARITAIQESFSALSKPTIPKAPLVNKEYADRLVYLETIEKAFDNFVNCAKETVKVEKKLQKAKGFVTQLIDEAEKAGVSLRICKNCGSVMEV